MELYCGNSLEITKTFADDSIDTIITDPPYGLKFMGKEWDHGVPGVEFWKEFLRVAKPGAILMAFGGTRTFHRLTVAIEDAGWEIRDCMMYLYGSGFPKSHDISKAIDKELGAEREVIGIDKARISTKNSHEGYKRPSHNKEFFDITAPNTDQAKEWDGWGTALKPAWEPIIIAMKPLDGTFADNAMTHGVAGLHIDAGRIETNDDLSGGTYGGVFSSTRDSNGNLCKAVGSGDKGRFPANLILDETSAEMLDEQSGISKSSGKRTGQITQSAARSWKNASKEGIARIDHNDSGGASRFFYCAKASKKERNYGLDDMEDKKSGTYHFRENGSLDGKETQPRANHHPTVKPIALLEYLCRLTETPSGGIIFDPFMGSGTTGIAAKITGRKFIGIDINQEYVDIARKRIESYGK